MLIICCQICPWWRFLRGHWAAFLALLHTCLKQHRNMFNLICVLHIKKPDKTCLPNNQSVFPLFCWWPWILGFLCRKSSLGTVWSLLSGTWFSVPCCALFQWDNDQGNCGPMGGLQGYVMRKPSRVICPHAVMLAHISKAELQTEKIMSAPKNLAIYASSFFYPLYWVTLKGSFFGPLYLDCWFLLLACPVTVLRLNDWCCNSHWGCCHGFPLWNGGNVILPHFSFLRVWKVLPKKKECPSWDKSGTTRMSPPCRRLGWRYSLEFPWGGEHRGLCCKFMVFAISAMVLEQGALLWPAHPSQVHSPNASFSRATLKYPQVLWPCMSPAQAFRKLNVYDKHALIRQVYGIYSFIYTGTYNCKLLQGTFTFVLMLFLYVLKWNRRGSLIGHTGTERQGAAISCSLQHKHIDSWTQRKGSKGNSVKSIPRQ